MSDKIHTCSNCIFIGIHNIETSNVPNWCNNQDSYLSGRIRHYLGTTCDKHEPIIQQNKKLKP